MVFCFLCVGSVVGLRGNAGQCVYSASKAGLEGFTRSLAKEVASRDVRVNLLAPGAVSLLVHLLFRLLCHRTCSCNGLIWSPSSFCVQDSSAPT